MDVHCGYVRTSGPCGRPPADWRELQLPNGDRLVVYMCPVCLSYYDTLRWAEKRRREANNDRGS